MQSEICILGARRNFLGAAKLRWQIDKTMRTNHEGAKDTKGSGFIIKNFAFFVVKCFPLSLAAVRFAVAGNAHYSNERAR